MKCDKCGYNNSEYDIICENCGSPLKIENNIELQKKYNHKQKAIDIEHIEPDTTKQVFDNTKKQIRNVFIFFIFLVVIISFIFIYNFIKDFYSRDIINQYNKFIQETEYGIIYLGEDQKASEVLVDYSQKYEFSYLYVDTSKITRFKRNRIKNNLGLKNIDETIVIIENGENINSFDNYTLKNKNAMIEFLQNNSVIPKQLGNPSKVKELFENSIIAKEPTLIYYVSNQSDKFEEHNKELKKFCSDYSINYSYIEGYYLTNKQKLSILSKLNYNEIQEELVVLVDEEQIKDVIEKVDYDKDDYFEFASNYGIIDESSSKSLKNINFNQVKSNIANENKSIIMFSSNNCEYCERIKPIIGKIGIQNNITIYHYQINDSGLEIVEEYLSEHGFKEGKITPPLVVITENNQILDYIIGLSDKELFESKFKEYGVIR